MIVRRASLAEIIALRHGELRPGLPRATATFDGYDADATIHTAALDGDVVVGCASWMPAPLDGTPAGQLRGMATRHDRVGQGIGRALLAFGEQEVVRTTGITLAWCNARVAAVGFYERCGWVVVSPEFDVPGVGPHRRMRRDLVRA